MTGVKIIPSPDTKARAELQGALFFVLRATLYSAILLIVYSQLPRHFWAPFEHSCAWIVWRITTSLGVHANLSGNLIASNAFSIEIIDQCLAVDLMLLLAAFIIAFPVTFKRKISGLLIGLPFIFTFNIGRIVMLFFIGNHLKSWFNLAHLFIGQIIMVLVIIILFSVWITASLEKNRSLFLLKLSGSMIILFVLWSFIKDPYYQTGRDVVSFLASSIIGPSSRFTTSDSTYEFTYSFVIFVSLVLSTGGIAIRRKIAGIAIGLAVLAAFQWTFVCMSVFSYINRNFRIYQLAIAVYQFSSYLLPVLLWLLLRSWKTPAAPVTEGGVCPICGARKTGMENHIRKKHGSEAMQSKAVRNYFEKNKSREPDGIFCGDVRKSCPGA